MSAGTSEPRRSAASRVTGSRTEPTPSAAETARRSVTTGSVAPSGPVSPSSPNSSPDSSTRNRRLPTCQAITGFRSVIATRTSSGSATVTPAVRTDGSSSSLASSAAVRRANAFWSAGIARAARMSPSGVQVAPSISVRWTVNAPVVATP